jgi:hypothetical protein
MVGIIRIQAFNAFKAVASTVHHLSHLPAHITILARQTLFPSPAKNLAELKDRQWSISKKFGLSFETLAALISIGQTAGLDERKEKVALLEKGIHDKELKALKKFKNRFDRSDALPIEIRQVKEAIAGLERLRKSRKKCEELKIDGKYFAASPWQMSFLFESHLIFKILNLQNSFDGGKRKHEIVLQDQQLFLQSPQKPFPVKTLIEEFTITEQHALKDKEGNVWSYFDKGFMDSDVFINPARLQDREYREKNIPLLSLGQLSAEQMGTLREYMRENYGHEPDFDQKKAVVQFIAQPPTPAKNRFFWGVQAQMGVHGFFRIIYEDGTVFSSGLECLLEEYGEDVFGGNRLKTVTGIPVNFELFESRKHAGCVVTSRPATQKGAERIVEQLNKMRAKLVRYNQVGNNCTTLSQMVLKETGVEVNFDVSIPLYFWRYLPSLVDLGMPKKLYHVIHSVVVGIMRVLNFVCPKIGKRALKALGIGILNLTFSLVIYILGGTRKAPEIEGFHDEADQKEDDWQFEKTDRVMMSRFFNANQLRFAHTAPFLHWQLKQQATFVVPYTGQPKMFFSPPKEENLLEQGRKLKEKFTKFYAHSAPV